MLVTLAFRNIVAVPETFDPLNPPEMREHVQGAIKDLVESFGEKGLLPYRNDDEGIHYGFLTDNWVKANKLAEDFRRQFKRHNQTWLTTPSDSIVIPASIFKTYRFEHQIACVANMYGVLALEPRRVAAALEYSN